MTNKRTATNLIAEKQAFIRQLIEDCLRVHQLPMALSFPLSRFPSRAGEWFGF